MDTYDAVAIVAGCRCCRLLSSLLLLTNHSTNTIHEVTLFHFIHFLVGKQTEPETILCVVFDTKMTKCLAIFKRY